MSFKKCSQCGKFINDEETKCASCKSKSVSPKAENILVTRSDTQPNDTIKEKHSGNSVTRNLLKEVLVEHNLILSILSAAVIIPVMTVVCVVFGLIAGIHDLFSDDDNQWTDTI